MRVNGAGIVAFPPEMKQGAKGEFLTFKVRDGVTLPDGRVIQGYHRCVMFGERGRVAGARIKEGTIVAISGSLSTRKDDTGKEWTSIRVDELSVVQVDAAAQPKSDRGYWGDPNATTRPQQTPAPQYSHAGQHPPQAGQRPPQAGNAYDDSDIPF